jgi:FtsP/CotA-like multicopper oxidase with cupredoxin domain
MSDINADQFPGPTIEARSGDILEINVLNSAQEDLSLHWHGLHLKGTYSLLLTVGCRKPMLKPRFWAGANRMDGAAGITQCPIKSGTNFTYQIPIGNQSGTFWSVTRTASQPPGELFNARSQVSCPFRSSARRRSIWRLNCPQPFQSGK